MRIGFVTQWFPPEPGTIVAAAIADGLASRGHEVEVLTGFPNYPSGKLQEDYPLRPYRRDERALRVVVHRAPLYPSHDGSPVKRMANYLSFACAASWVARRRVPRPDVWLVYSSPATSAVPAIVAALGTAVPIYLLIEDLWPDSVTQSGMVAGPAKRLMGAALDRFCSWVYRRSTGIGVISPSLAPVLVDRGVSPATIHYTPNWVQDPEPPQSQPNSELRRALGLPEGRLFMYAGNMGELQGLEPLVRAFPRVLSAHFTLIGGGVVRERLQEIVRREQISNVSFLDPVPSAEIGGYIAASDVQVVSLQDTPLLRATMPSKVQSSLAAGKPVLVHAAGDVADLVSTHGLGLVCRPGDQASTVRAIEILAGSSAGQLDQMGRKGRALFEREFSATASLDRLEGLLVSGRGGRTFTAPTPTPPAAHLKVMATTFDQQCTSTAHGRHKEDKT